MRKLLCFLGMHKPDDACIYNSWSKVYVYTCIHCGKRYRGNDRRVQ